MSIRARRAFLSQVGCGLITTVLWSFKGAELGSFFTDESRARKALQLRIEAAQAQYAAPVQSQKTNGDSEKHPSYFANYSKALPHNDAGLVDPFAYWQLLTTLDSTGRP